MNSGLILSNLLLTNEQLEAVQKYGALAYHPEKICILLEIKDKENFLLDFENEKSDVYLAYWKGYYEAEYLVDKGNMEDAQAGKAEAVKRYDKRLQHNEIMKVINEIDAQSY